MDRRYVVQQVGPLSRGYDSSSDFTRRVRLDHLGGHPPIQSQRRLDVDMVHHRTRVTPRSHTSFETRFPGKRRRLDEGLPPIASWRNNLVSRPLHQAFAESRAQ